MRRSLAAVLVACSALAACRSGGDVRVVRVPPPAPPPPTARYEVVTIARVATAATARPVEVAMHLLGNEPLVQTVESTSVRIVPALPYRIEHDASGNRVLRVAGTVARAVEVHVCTHVRRSAVAVDLGRAEERALSELEARALGGELAGVGSRVLTLDGARAVGAAEDAVARARALGFPARLVSGVAIGEGVRPVTWAEIYVPGLAWVPAAWGMPLGVLGAQVLAVARGAGPVPWVAGGDVSVEGRRLDERP